MNAETINPVDVADIDMIDAVNIRISRALSVLNLVADDLLTDDKRENDLLPAVMVVIDEIAAISPIMDGWRNSKSKGALCKSH